MRDHEQQHRGRVADSPVVAVPIPALRQIAFAPPLPPEKTAALKAVSSTPVAESAVRLRRALLGTSGVARQPRH